MVFNKNIKKSQIEEFENECLNKVIGSPMFTFLKKQLIKKKYNFKIEVQRSEMDLNKYQSYLAIDIFNEKGERLCEYDEPDCCLMLCESLCFIHNGHIIGIDLSTDEHFLESLKLLIKQVDKSVRFD